MVKNSTYQGHAFRIAVIIMLAIVLLPGVASAYIPVNITLNKKLINFNSQETFTVDILTDATFNATTDNVNISSITFGGAPVKKAAGAVQYTDPSTGLPYLKLQFQLFNTRITCGNLTVFLTGYTNNGTLIVGSSTITLQKFCTPGTDTPTITNYTPLDWIVSNNVSENRTFGITVNQIVNVSWSITGVTGQNVTYVQSDYNVYNSTYNNSVSSGNWNVVAVATNSNGTATIFGTGQIPSWLWIVSKVNTSVSVNSSFIPSTFGQNVTFTATVDRAVSGTDSEAGTPTGTVEFFNGSTSLGIGSLIGNIATLSTSTLGVGSNSITAVYSGDNNFSASTSPPIIQTVVTKETPTINWSNPADITYPAALSGIQLNATATIAGNFTYTPPAGTVLSAGSGQALFVTFTPTDTSDYNTATKNVTINVLKAATSTVVTDAIGTFGGITTLSATLTSAGSPLSSRSISFMLNGNSVGSASTNATGVATLTSVGLAGIAANTYPNGVGASFAGDTNYSGNTSTGQLIVSQATATVNLTNLTQTYTGNPLRPTATTTPGDLAISWTNAPQIAAGSYQVTATVNDSNYTGSASGTFNINKATATVTLTNLIQTYNGSPLTPTANTTPAGLAITWTGAPQTNVGTYTVTATVNDSNYEGSATGTFNITKASATVTLGNLTQIYSGNPLTPTADTNPIGLKVDWTGAPQTNVGSYQVIATINDSNYEGSATGTFNITKASATVTLNASELAQTYDGTLKSVTVTTSPAGLTGVSVTYNSSLTLPTAAGSYNVVATLTNDNYTATDATGTLVIGKADTSITMTSSQNLSTYGQSVTFNATITPSAATGTVQFTIDGSNFGSPVTVSGGSATSSAISTLSVGTHTITAMYSGDSNYSSSTGTLSDGQVVNKALLTITADDKTKDYGAPLPTLTVSYSGFVNDDTSASLTTQPTISTTGTKSSPVGSYPITASGAVDNNYAISYVAGTLSVIPVALTIMADDKTKDYGADLSPLTVSYSGFVNDDTSASLTTQPIITTTATASSSVGSYPITASDAVDNNYTISYVAGTLTVIKADTTTMVSSSINPSVFGQAVTFTAIVTPVAPGAGLPTGTVFFNDSGVTIGTGTLNASGQANFSTTSLSVATHAITAEYVGDGNFNDSTSSTLNQIVNRVDTNTAIASSVNLSVFGQTVNFTVTVTANSPGSGIPGGNVQFKIDGSNFGAPVTLSGTGTASSNDISTLPVGGHTVDAIYSGNTSYNASTGTLMQTVNQASTTTVVYSSENPSTYGDLVTFTANMTSSGESIPDGETVTFKDGSTTLGTSTTSSGNATISISTLSTGSHSIAANYTGDSNFSTSEGLLTQIMNKADPTISVASYSVTYDGNSHTATGSATGVNSESLSGLDLTGTTHTNAGDYPSDAWTFTDSTGNYEDDSGTVHDIISKATLTVAADDKSRVYGEPNPTFTANYSGFKNEETLATSRVSGSPSLTTTADPSSPVSSSPYTITAAAGTLTSENYEFNFVNGNLTITKAETTTSLNSSINPSVSGQSVNFTDTVSAVAPGAGTPNGTVQFKIDGSNFGLPVALSNGSATSISNSSLSIGTHTITAEYSGDGNFNSSTSSALTQTVNKVSTTIPTTRTSSSAGGSSGSSGCGSGVISKENLSNIKQYESREANVHISEGATVFRFATLGIVNETGFTAKTNEGCIAARGEVLKERPSQATSDAPGTGTVYFNVWLGPSGYDESSKIEKPYIIFSAPAEKNNESVKLMMYKNNSWIDLKTEKIDTGTYRAYTRGFGSFAIVKTTETPVETPSETLTQSAPTPVVITNEPATQKPTNWALIMVVFILIVGMVIGYRKYRKNLSRKKADLQK